MKPYAPWLFIGYFLIIFIILGFIFRWWAPFFGLKLPGLHPWYLTASVLVFMAIIQVYLDWINS